jgi:hypothetical protein
MLEISALAKLKLKLMGSEYELTKPTSKQAKAIQEALASDEGKASALDTLTQFLVDAGLPKEVAEGLQLEHMNLIFEHLMGAKKN